MRHKPRSIFRARVCGRVLHIGPEWTGRQPDYQAKALEAAARSGPLEPGKVYSAEIRHSDDCENWS